MKLRAKIFLVTLLPAAVLVAAGAAAAIVQFNSRSEASARQEFDRLRKAFEGVHKEQILQLRRLGHQFDNPKVQAAIKDAIETKDFARLKPELDYFFDLINFTPDFYELHSPKGGMILRSKHACSASCRHELPAWVNPAADGVEVLTEFEGQPYLAFWKGYEAAHFIVGTHQKRLLDDLFKAFTMQGVLVGGSGPVYSSIPGAAVPEGDGMVSHGGVRYLASRSRPENSLLDLVLLRDMSDVDRDRGRVLAVFAGGLAATVVTAALVSFFLSRGVFRSVETLVDATRRVGEGDYAAKVEVAGRDELARLGSAFNDMTEGLRRRREIMEKTLSRDVAEELMKGTELGGERREVTVLFLDVRGFTSGTQGVDPAEVVALLNDMMERLAGAVTRQGGNVNKFLGDGLMAMFGAPRALEDHAFRAVAAALEMQREMADWNAARSARGLPNFSTGIGINTGTALGGRVGSRARLEYTLIGEEVNLASRLCGKAEARQVLVSDATWQRLGGRVRGRALEPVVVKGLSYPVKVWEAAGC